ncbi:MAG TPA: glutamine--fructose-6-phosphate transaminase (isomerizing) [Bacillota bacterium]|jgi:glucosamine--fructose-6-phosphate aminotransferase (isomerizing)|nr:glutamine--fructose-6-phosphate transaminase (isomerizing) [Bacillota bacterium]HRS21064.1 glutamine--fructose-6-phosphate transaminase (isomerizing) [Clostridia bacterium]HRU40719.1 glutamine--fructose-6-phosphate transaminase (isomerizing) [Candidatus Diapherotrites archaeon]HQI16236.1 glutamine--fructose-6-phosphate transaminase (isomerizing) [Bacillota bacterium]HQJ36564.1 glutamine--fructose-6-phosphate transaminase (isomerizing) [Bacillota bacterium]
MCGIVGYIGDKNAVPILMEGLHKLEYRGYDSAGVAVYTKESIEVRKYKGRLSVLEEHLKKETMDGCLGIGHTRWATHGEPSDMNSHPHTNCSGDIAVVHNGIIENYMSIKSMLIEKGYTFRSETDTEVLAHYVDYFYKDDLLEAVTKVLEKIRGSYAFAVISKREPDKIICVRKENPLIVGIGNGENFIASDIPAILNHTRRIYLLNEKELAVVEKDRISFFDESGKEVGKEVFEVNWDVASAEKGGFEHFMIKEIHEQPKAVKDTMTSRVLPDSAGIKLDDIKLTKEELQNFNKIYMVACGTAYHACMVGKYVIEKLARIPVEVEIASEFRYRDPIVDEKTLTIIVSQSGETLDTLAALKEARRKGSRILSIVNVVGSSIARESHDVFYTWAGPEIAVASTKAYTTQLIAIYIIALYMAKLKGTLKDEEIESIKDEMRRLPELVEETLKYKSTIQKFATHNSNARDIFYLGRGIDYAVALEGSLKLKEISYIHSEAYAAGELKHGTIALIEKGTIVMAVLTQDELYEKMVSNVKEVKARGAFVFAIAKEGNTEVEKVADYTLYIPKVSDILAPVVAVMPLQLLAYYMAVEKGCDVDKPRNLAKSVTVE